MSLRKLSIASWSIVLCACGAGELARPKPMPPGDAGSSMSRSDASSGHADDAGRTKICDGSDGLRLAIAVDGQIGRAFAFQAVQLELGFPYIYVDGHCHYWTTYSSGFGPDRVGRWRPVRTGEVTHEEEDALATLGMYDDFGTLQQGCNRGSNLSDAPVTHFFNGSSQAHCYMDAPIVQGFMDAWRNVATPMYERGNPVPPEAGVRVEVGPAGSPTRGETVYAWPLTEPLSDFLVPTGKENSPGVSRLVTNRDSVAALLALRDTFVQDQAGGSIWDQGLRVETYFLYMREELPFTNAIGLLPFQMQP